MKTLKNSCSNASKQQFLVPAIALLLLLTCCDSREDFSNGTNQGSNGDSVKQDDTSKTSSAEEDNHMKSSMIFYQGAEDNAVRKSLETFFPFSRIQELATAAVRLEDSLYWLRGAVELKDPKDTLFLKPYKDHVYKEMLSYQQLMTSAPPAINIAVGLLQLTRTSSNNDSIVGLLPAAKSDFLSHKDFFFLGGAPFISEIMPEEKTVFTDPAGNPETRFEISVPENTSYLMNSVYHLNKAPFQISYERALHSDNGGQGDIYNIGAVTHMFTERIAVFFLTESGVVPAQLVSVSIKLFPQSLGCVSDQPTIILACSQKLSEKEILGVYIPYKSGNISFKMTRQSDKLWTADLNNDGIPDLACISDTFDGIMDNLAEVLWYVNINGSWKIIDWAETLDCT